MCLLSGKKYNTIFIFLFLFFAVFIFTQTTFASEITVIEEDNHGNIRLENDYIAIIVNQDENAMGRFAVETTGGDPMKTEDENMPLIYGRPQPWPSYTTIKINGENYVFGGETGRRAGRDGLYGQVKTPPQVIEGEKILTVTDYDGILVEQILSFSRGITTGLYDSARIEYRIENTTEQEKEIGIRIMLDTMLGENDGAPFMVRDQTVDTDRRIAGEDLPDFWQAFDSISTPTVISQGTFRRPEVTVPEAVYFSDWGSLADGIWNFDFNPGQEFIRAGGFDIDSAMAMYWNPETLLPGESRVYSTEYGLGGVDIVPGLLSLLVPRIPDFAFQEQDDTFDVIANIGNDSEIVLEDVTVEIELSDGFNTVNYKRQLGDFEPGHVEPISWEVGTSFDIHQLPAEMNFQITADAANTDANQAAGSVGIIGPEKPEIAQHQIEDLYVRRGMVRPNPFKITASIKNTGGLKTSDQMANLLLGAGLRLADKDSQEKFTGFIKPGEEVELSWYVRITEGIEGAEVPFAINFGDLVYNERISIPEVSPLFYLQHESYQGEKNRILVTEINAANIFEIDNIDLNISYSTQQLKLVEILPGNIFIANNNNVILWEEAELSDGQIKLRQNLPHSTDGYNIKGSIARLLFRVIDDYDNYDLPQWEDSYFYDEQNELLEIDLGVF